MCCIYAGPPNSNIAYAATQTAGWTSPLLKSPFEPFVLLHAPNVHRPNKKQMARNDMHLDDSGDTVKYVGSYQTAAEFWRLRAQKTVVIQRFWRGFSARSRVWARREENWKRQASWTKDAGGGGLEKGGAGLGVRGHFHSCERRASGDRARFLQ